MEIRKTKIVGKVFVIALALTMLSSLLVLAQPQPTNEIFMVEVDNADLLQRIENSGAKILVNYNNGYALIEAREGYSVILEDSGINTDAMPERTMVNSGPAGISFDWEQGEPDIPNELKAPADWNTYIVMFVGPIQSSAWTQELIDLGASVHSTVGFGYVLQMDDATKSTISALPNIAWIGDYHPAYKISHDIGTEGIVMVEAHAFPDANIPAVASAIGDLGATINKYSENRIHFSADVSLIPSIASMSEIQLMFHDAPKFTRDIMANEVHGSIDAWYPSWSGLPQSLDGSGEVIGIQDTGFDEGNQADGHCDFFDGPDGDRVIRFNDRTGYSVPDGLEASIAHGTHCAGLVIANGWCWETWMGEPTNDQEWHLAESTGVIPRAELSFDGVSASGGGVAADPTYWNDQYADGARAMSNSYGPPSGDYGGGSTTVDNQMNGDTRMILFASGNDGPEDDTTDPDNQGKNGLTVGANQNFRPDQFSADNPNLVTDFSSRGGTFSEGRIKPDIVAGGTAAISAFSRGEWEWCENNNWGVPQPSWIMKVDEYDWNTGNPGQDGIPDYQYMQGTSMSCPVASGGYLMVREYLREIEAIATPPSELTKAMLLNGCEKQTEELFPYPGYDQGWGRMNIKNSIYPDAPATIQYDTNIFSVTGNWAPAFNMNVESGAFLKVTAVWKDVSGISLSRDVDLTLTAPGGDVYKGNSFTDPALLLPYWSTPNADANRPSAKAGGYDGINNVEQIWIEVPEAGLWTIDVNCVNTNGDVPVAVVMSADVGPQNAYAVDLTTDYPTTFSIVAGGETNFQFNVFNFGLNNDVFDLTEDSPFTVTWSPTSPVSLDTGKNTDVVATFSAGAVAAGIYDFKITGTSQGDINQFDNLFLTIEVLDQRLPYQYQITSSSLDEVDPAVTTFTDSVGTSHIFIAFVKTTADGDRMMVAYDTLQADGTPTGAWTELILPAPSPDYIYPNDPRIYVMPGGSYEDRVFVIWTGWLVGAAEGEESSAWISYADRGSYGSWSTVLIDQNTGNDAENYKRVNFLCMRPSANEIIYGFEHLDYPAGGTNPSGVDTHYRPSTTGGATWGAAAPITPGDGNYYFFPNGVTDQNDVIWVWFYMRTSGGDDRDLYLRLYDGALSAGMVDVWNTADNVQFPTCWATNEGAAGNRNYFGVTRDQGGTTFTLWTGYIDGDFTSASPPADTLDGWGNTAGPFGSALSDSNYNRRPVLAGAGTGDGYSWVAYMENDNPYGVPNMDTICSNDGFASHTTYRVTADSYAKGHQMVSTLALGGDNMYEVFHSSHGTTTDVDYNIYLIIYSFGWPDAPDTEGPITSAVIANPNPVDAGGTFTLSATIDDTQTGFSGIQAAEYILGPLDEAAPPTEPAWPGTGMTVSGNSQIETGTATVNSIGAAGQTFYAWVRGQDAGNVWGDGSYVLVEVAGAATGAPNAPFNPVPADTATGIGLNPDLFVDVTDPDGDTMDVEFYDAAGPTLIGTDNNVASGGTATVPWNGLAGSTTYNWYAIAYDAAENTQSATWSFTTAGTAPAAPINPVPADTATGIGLDPALSVDVSDPNGDPMDVEFWDASGPSLIGTDNNVASGGVATITWNGLISFTTYNWYAIAYDAAENTQSATWSFTTADSTPPGAPTGLTVEWFSVASASGDALPSVIDAGDTAGTTVAQINADDGTTNTIGKNIEMWIDAFDTTGAADPVTAATIWMEFSVEAGHDGINPVEFSLNEGIGWITTGIVPTNGDTNRVASFDIFASGVDTVAEIAALDVYYFNDDGAGSNPVYFDYVWITYTYGGGAGTEHNQVNWTASADDGAGFDDVDYYQIYRSDVEAGPWDVTTEYTQVTAIDAATYNYEDLNAGEFDGTFWWYVVRAVDLSSNMETNTVAVQEPAPSDTAYDIDMSAFTAGSWAFVSFPYVMSGNIETVLTDASGGGTTWDVAKWYDPQDAEDPWRTHRIGESGNDLATINNQMGVWLHLLTIDDFLTTSTIGDYAAGNVDIPLYVGWNLVSYPSATDRTASDTLPAQADMVAYYNVSAEYLITDALPTAVTFVEGNAYWVRVTADVVWSVAP